MNATSPLSGGDLRLVGRDEELARVTSVLDKDGSALVVACGRVGYGKSSFLRAVAAEAAGRGWSVVPSPGDVLLAVGPDTTPQGFCQVLGRLVGLPGADQDAEGNGAAAQDEPGDVAGSVEASGDQEGSLASTSESGATASGATASRTGDSTATNLLNSVLKSAKRILQRLQDPSPQLVGRLEALSPLLLLVDDYRADGEFAKWFSAVFVSRVRDAQRVMVLVGVEVDLLPTSLLGERADEIVRLGPLDEGALGSFFTELGRSLDPPIDEDEVGIYVEGTKESPELLDALRRLLPLSSASEA